MSLETSAIWQGLRGMRIEPEGAVLSFTARLARENRWSAAHAAAVMEEYRRFLYLAAISGRAVTPSEDVDQAWHLHLAHSRHYWDVLCGTILKRPLHHGPTEGGPAEARRYHDQYRETLALYRATFGSAPPANVWPDAHARFAVRPVRIDAARNWVIPRAWGSAAMLAGASLMLIACSAIAANSAGESSNGFSPYWLIAPVFIAVVLIQRSHRQKGKKGRNDGGGCGTSGSGCSGDSSSDSGGDSGCGGGCGGD